MRRPTRSSQSRGWLAALNHRIDAQRRRSLFRSVRSVDPALVDLASNDYLALRRHRRLVSAVADAALAFGVGAGSSRLVVGTTELHRRVEARLAGFKNAAAALLLPTGYQANLAVLTSLPRPSDLILMDRLNHASLIDGALLAAARSGSRSVALRRFRHRDADHACDLARRHIARRPDAAIWLVSDSVFSMDGDIAPIDDLAAVRDRLNETAPGGCCLILDEAHATGVLGPTGAGADEQAGHRADLCVWTASKALGSLGGVITGPQTAIDAIVNFARPFIYTTAIPPTQVAAIDAALDVIRDEPERRQRLGAIARRLRSALVSRGWPARTLGDDPTPIIPLVVGDPESALSLERRLEDAGFYAPAIRPPSVPRGGSRVRLSLSASLTDAQLERLIDAIAEHHRAGGTGVSPVKIHHRATENTEAKLEN